LKCAEAPAVFHKYRQGAASAPSCLQNFEPDDAYDFFSLQNAHEYDTQLSMNDAYMEKCAASSKQQDLEMLRKLKIVSKALVDPVHMKTILFRPQSTQSLSCIAATGDV
jgi:hypothetical protein